MSTIENSGDRSTISINSHCLTYTPTVGADRTMTSRVLAKAIPLALAAVLAVVATIVVSIQAVGAQVDVANDEVVEGTDAKLKSVRFDLEDAGSGPDPLQAAGAPQEARYRELVVSHTGGETRLEPLAGLVRVTLTAEHSTAMAADINGREIGSGAPGFTDSLADAISSSSAHRYVRLSSTQGGEPLSLDVAYARPLTGADYLLIQEGGGNGHLELRALDAQGSVIGVPIAFGPSYQWNTGHGSVPGITSWASVVTVADLQTGSAPVAAIRVSAAYAEVKVVALTGLIDSPLPPPPGTEDGVAETEDQAGGDPSIFAAVGLTSSIVPAIAVDGVGCAQADSSSDGSLVAGSAATFCFTVTNLGRTKLAEITITDERLGLVNAVLPRASGPEVLQPGEQAVYYYHSVVDQRPSGAPSLVTAKPIDDAGLPIAGLIDPSGSGATGAAISAAEGQPQPAVAGRLIESDVPPVMAAGTGASLAQTAPAQTAQVPSVQAPSPQAKAVDLPGAGAAIAAAAGPTETPALTQLAHTGMPTEPWVLVIFAMAFIFIGYTAYAAFQQNLERDEPCGHEQLDSLGFD